MSRQVAYVYPVVRLNRVDIEIGSISSHAAGVALLSGSVSSGSFNEPFYVGAFLCDGGGNQTSSASAVYLGAGTTSFGSAGVQSVNYIAYYGRAYVYFPNRGDIYYSGLYWIGENNSVDVTLTVGVSW